MSKLKVTAVVLPKFLTAYTYDSTVLNYAVEYPVGPSETVPDQSLSVRDIFDRYARGESLDIVNDRGFYEDDIDSDFSDEIVDSEFYRDDFLTYNDELKRRIKDEQGKYNNQSDSQHFGKFDQSQSSDGGTKGSEVPETGSQKDN